MKSVFTKIIGKKIGRRFSIIRGKKNTGKQKSINSALPKKCQYSELFSPAFSRSRIEYGEIRSISPYSVRMWENADQNNSEYGHFSRSAGLKANISTSEIAEIVSMKWVKIAFLGLNPFIWHTISWKYISAFM